MSAPQKVLVSGGSRGLGEALVRALLDDGASVATFSRKASPFVDECRARAADRFLWQAVDGADPDQLRSFAEAAASAMGGLDALVNNAAVAIEGVLPLAQSAEIDRVVQTNLAGSIHLAQACARILLRGRRGGAIVNVTSVVGLRGYAGLAAYSATKAGMDGLTRSLARELGPRAIRVNSVAPGYLETELSRSLSPSQREQIVRRTPLGRLGTVDDVVGAVTFLLSERARFITGAVLVVDGGLSC